jgi:membrane-associated phospholipid phosphatase
MKDDSLFDYLVNLNGQYAPSILFFYTTYILFEKKVALFYFIIGFFINIILNLCLKGVFKQPRPGISDSQLKLFLDNKKRFITKNGFPYDIFGMPSGHSQLSLYCTTFMIYTINNYIQLSIYILLSLCTLYQRVNKNHHTISQVLLGGLTGIFMGIIIFNLYSESIKGKLTSKKDDNAIN